MDQQASILIGCDEPSVVDAIRILLARSDRDGKTVQFTTSSHGDEFIRQASSGDFDLAIMHANCLVPIQPFCLHEQAVFAVRSIKAFRSIRLVVLTTMEALIEPLRAAGADVCLKTPFLAKELLAAVSASV